MVSDIIQKFCGERPSPHSRGVCLHHTNRLADPLGRNTQPSADSTNGGAGRGDEWVCAKVEVEHERIRAFNEDTLLLCERLVDIRDTVENEWLQPLGQFLVAHDLGLGVVLKIAVAFKAAFDNLAELLRESTVIKQVVYP